MHEQLLKDNAGARNAASGSTEPGYARARVLISCGPMRVTSACFGKWLVVGTIVVVLAALPVCVWELRAERHAEAHIVAWFVGGVFALLACLISMIDIANHLMHFSEKVLQTYMIRIMWMVPIYAVESWLSLRFKDEAIYIETARECYEAYVIYSFTYFMMYYCAKGDEEKFAAELALRDRHHGKHLPPVSWCFKQWELGHEFLNKCKFGALQYVVIRVVCTIITFIMVFAKAYCNGALTDFGCGYIYITFIVNCSQVWAMYCLVLFYHATYKDLEPLRPFPKFVCIKAVVFFSFWQAVAIAMMVKLGWIHATLTYTIDEVADGLQDFIICIEMFFAAIAHHYYYSYHDVVADDAAARVGFIKAFFASSMPTDVIQDVVGTARAVTPGHKHSSSRGDDVTSMDNPLVSAEQKQHRRAASAAAKSSGGATSRGDLEAGAGGKPKKKSKRKRKKQSKTNPDVRLRRDSQFDASFRVDVDGSSSGSDSGSEDDAQGSPSTVELSSTSSAHK